MNPVNSHAAITFVVGEHGEAFLITRDDGMIKRSQLEKRLDRHREARLLVIDFHGIQAMTNSFADELIGKLYISLAAGDVTTGGVTLTGLNEETRDAITVCLERRKLIAVDGDEQQLLASDELMQSTYSLARRLENFRASELAAELSISLPNANNRLKRLVEAGALCRQPDPERERGGKQFSYSLPQQPAGTSS